MKERLIRGSSAKCPHVVQKSKEEEDAGRHSSMGLLCSCISRWLCQTGKALTTLYLDISQGYVLQLAILWKELMSPPGTKRRQAYRLL